MRYKLKTSLQTVKKILHIADIHIRLYKRHQEYETVFKNLYAELDARDLTNTIIVVAGDIVHAKTDMSPEMVRIASAFLRELADRTDTIIIAGNHDLNLANPHRLDALTPIVDNLKHKNLHYLRMSGIYEFADVEFGVHSIIGESSEWPVISNFTKTKPKIALYHAPVNKAQTDVGYSVTSRVTTDVFDGYDMVLLGDIHKSQILQEKSVGKPEIFYVGSLIQQNHGESLDNHGYAVWDVRTSKVEEFVEVKNDYGYCTLTLDSKKLPSTSHLPKFTRLRLFVGNVDQSLVKKAIATIRKNNNIVEMSVNKLVDKITRKNGSGIKSVIDNINDVSHQNELITDYIQTTYPSCDENLIQKVLDINTKLNSEIGDDDLPKNVSWEPLYLKFDNLFSYGEGNEVNFEEMNGIMGVFSPNATGKTSAFDAMCFALYDKTPRAFKGNHIMNTRKNKFFCELIFRVENTKYIIQRIGTRKKTGDVKVDVNFFKVDGDSKISLNGEDRRDTNNTIRSHVGTYEDFILTTLSVQNQNSLFIDTGQTDRKDLLSKFIGLTVFDKLSSAASDDIKEVLGALKSFKKDDFTQKLADVQTEYSKVTKEYDTINNEIDISRKKIDNYETNLIDLYSKKLPILVTEDIDVLKASRHRIDAQHKKLLTKLLVDEGAHDVYDNLVADLKHQLSKFPPKSELISGLKTKSDTEKALFELRYKLKLVNADIESKQNYIESLSKHKYDPSCKFCLANPVVVKAVQAKEEIIQLNALITVLTNDIEKGEQYAASLEEIVRKLDDLEVLDNKLNETLQSHSRASIELNKTITDQKKLEYELFELDRKINEFEKNEHFIEFNKQIDIEINDVLQNKNKLITQLNSQELVLRKLTGSSAILRRERDELVSKIKSAEELEDTFEAYEIYLNVVGRDGLPYQLMSTVVPELQTQVNNLLSQMVDFTLSLDVDGKNINGRIVYDDARTWPLELASGMEKFISSLAIRVGLMSVSNLPKANFLVIDEGLGVLDSDNLSSMFMLFDVLKTQFEFIILISHLDVVRDIADNLIEIKRDDGYSYLKV